jgi:hypothetical protein
VKKITLFSALLVCVFLSCKKSSSNSSSSYHVTATIGGKAETFNVTPVATRLTNGGFTLIAVSGFAAASSTTEVLSLSLTNDPGQATFKAGTYSDTASGYAIGGVYKATTANQYVAGSSVTQPALGSGTPVTNHFSVIITSIDSATIKGTFSGDYFLYGDPTAAKVTITNGDFYAKFQ